MSMFCTIFISVYMYIYHSAELAGAVEYADCMFGEE